MARYRYKIILKFNVAVAILGQGHKGFLQNSLPRIYVRAFADRCL